MSTYLNIKITTHAVLLRILTKKSMLLFGKYSSATVERIMKTHPQYLKWAYYNLSNISFTNEILIWLGIDKCGYINKPGKDTALWDELVAESQCKYTTRQGYQYLKAKRKISKDHIRIQNSTNQNLAKLAWYNQGHR